MEGSLEGRVAVVTGASRGIGLAIARRFADAGASVVISSRNEANLAQALGSFSDGERVLPIVAHVGSSEDASRVARSAIERFGSLDILVNNAGTNPYFGPLVDLDEGRMQKTYEINQASVLTLWPRPGATGCATTVASS